MKIRFYGRTKPFYTIITAIAILFISGATYYLSYENLKSNVMESLEELSGQGARTVEAELRLQLDLLGSIAAQSIVSDPSVSLENKLQEIKRQAVLKGAIRYGISDLNGNTYTTDGKRFYNGDREYYLKALKGKRSIQGPVISRADERAVVAFAVPQKDDRENIIGVIHAAYNINYITDIIRQIKFGNDGIAFIINKRGTVIACGDPQKVFIIESYFDKTKIRIKNKELIGLEDNMLSGIPGSSEYLLEKVTHYIGYAPINGTDWFIAVTTSRTQATEKVHKVIYIINIVILLFILVSIFTGVYSHYLKKRLIYEEEVSRGLIDIANILSIRLKYDGTIISFNKYAEIATQFSYKEVVNKSFVEMLEKEDRIKFFEIRNSLKTTDSSENVQMSLKRKDGKLLHIIWNANMKDDYKDKSIFFIINMIGMDLTERIESERNIRDNNEKLTQVLRELESSQEELRNKYDELNITKNKLVDSEQRFQLSLEGSNDAIWDWNALDNKVFYSDKFYEITGYSRGDIGDSSDEFRLLFHPEDIKAAEEAKREHFQGLTPNLFYEVRIKTKNTEYIWILVKGKAIKDEAGNLVRMAGSITNINDKKIHEQMIKKLAYYDLLTGLPNKLVLKEHTGKAVEDAIKSGNSGVLVLIDIDNFKLLNDSFGHYYGDLLLVELSNMLISIFDSTCMVSRTGGDEFAVLIPKVSSDSLIKEYIDKIMAAFSKTFNVDGNIFYITASMGIALFPDESKDFDTLLKNADTAMNYAKKMGKPNYKIYTKTLNDEIMEKVRLASSLRKALENNEFQLYYQPQYITRTREICGFEALLRWNSPEYGFVMPGRFISLAEENGFIIPLGDWVLKQACLFKMRLKNEVINCLNISVNISIVQLMQEDFVEKVLCIVNETGLDPEFLEIELTESVLIQSIDENLIKLKRLRENGVKISLDDFGKGFSSLSYLKNLPVNTLKIDKEFVDDIGLGTDITDSIVHIGQKMGLKVIAEGVETDVQYQHLINTNCDMVQGYYLGRPVPEDDAIKMIVQQLGYIPK
ncbi:bifunctional diguanylate cyclase/phosphodiesterase [Pseudobacteroides cellulosolvens]|uniref:Diguanylate cyclase/phosphodiesterase with PAS/PAC sensor(S) n=1 Tax=Pseudobacteroides cellulosolvens ATCC 35603 = DSM 2933 TaxID=398512 RepID=A0A0L6JX28_9FIRM|nr:EAL domain-containing protein [Pseudobacteroides cellulosolvens]KNY30406.1 diguanylate cyclase/phosphodiesterase with PAS/PAC sensor(s) [Pseudobacteroides cellulosolvens ATCC 35603 = DSM 2933]